MMIHKRLVLLAGLIICLVAGSSWAQDSNTVAPASTDRNAGTEKVAELGDRALALHVAEWIKGRPVKIQPGTNIYVLIFCTLSRADDFALTNLSSLEEKYRDKGLITVAISPESPDQIKQFVQINGAKIDFTVAADELPGRTANNYMHAFRQMQLPHAFVVGKDGTVLWQGHPLTDGMGEVVDEIASGQYDLKQTKQQVLSRGLMDQYIIFARMGDARSRKAGRMVLANRKNDAAGLLDLAFKIVTDPEIDSTNRDAALATTALNRSEQLTTTNATDIAVTRAMLLFQTGDQEAGLLQAKDALEFAKSQNAKDEVQACIRAMELRIAMAKTNQVAAVTGTNQVKAAASTNQTGTLADKP
jgi:hypothetical protein